MHASYSEDSLVVPLVSTRLYSTYVHAYILLGPLCVGLVG